MSDPLRQYLEECGSLCPHCRETPSKFFKAFQAERREVSDISPMVDIFCHCWGCGKNWFDRYTLTAASFDGETFTGKDAGTP